MAIDYKVLREATGLSLEEFANQLGLDADIVKSWEEGKGSPDAMNQKRIFALVKKHTERGQ